MAECTPKWAAEICDVPATRISEAAEILGSAERLLSTALPGVYQSHQGTAAAVQVNNLHLLRGMLGRPGAGVLQMNGQPTAQNTGECGVNGDHTGKLAAAGQHYGPTSMKRLLNPPLAFWPPYGRKPPKPSATVPNRGLLLLQDLRDLYLAASQNSLYWEMLAQVAQAAKDSALLELATACHPQALRRIRWTNTMIKDLSPQILTSL